MYQSLLMYGTKTIVPRFNLLLPSSRTIVITYELHMVAKGCVFIYIVGIARLTNRITSATCVVLHYFIYEPNDSFVLITIIRMPSDSVRSIGMLILYALFSSSKLINQRPQLRNDTHHTCIMLLYHSLFLCT